MFDFDVLGDIVRWFIHKLTLHIDNWIGNCLYGLRRVITDEDSDRVWGSVVNGIQMMAEEQQTSED